MPGLAAAGIMMGLAHPEQGWRQAQNAAAGAAIQTDFHPGVQPEMPLY